MAEITHQWAWQQVYVDPPRHERELSPGHRGIPIAPGKFPPRYMIANGRPGGGSSSAAVSDGTLPIRIQPPPSGNGRLTFVANYKFLAANRTRGVVELAATMGVTSPNQSNKPMNPYLGVGHDQDTWTDNLVHMLIQPGDIVQVTGFRLDIVDNVFNAVPSWPHWQMDPNPANLLWPALCPTLRIRGGNLVISGVFCIGFAC